MQHAVVSIRSVLATSVQLNRGIYSQTGFVGLLLVSSSLQGQSAYSYGQTVSCSIHCRAVELHSGSLALGHLAFAYMSSTELAVPDTAVGLCCRVIELWGGCFSSFASARCVDT